MRKTIKLSDIKKLISESILEANLGKNPFAAKKPAAPVAGNTNTYPSQNTPATNTKPQLASAPSKGGQHFPDVSYCFTEHDDSTGQDIIRLGIVYIFQQHIPILKKAFEKAQGVFTITVPKNQFDTIEFDIPEENLDKFKQILPIMKEYIKRAASLTRNTTYDQKSLDNLDKDIMISLDNCPSSTELNAVSQKIANNYREMMNTLNDPVYLKKLNALVAFYPNNGEYADIDHQLSDKDKYMILAQDPNATYVTTALGWSRLNREVVDLNRYILCKKPSKEYIDKSVRDAVARQMGFGSLQNYYQQVKLGKVPSGKIHKFDMDCQYKSDDSKMFMYVTKMYDVTNTRVIAGMPDKWAEEERFIDNLRGLPNDVARNNRNIPQSGATQNQQAPSQLQAGKLSNAMLVNGLNVLERAMRNLNTKLDDRAKINFIESGNVSEDIGSLIEQYELRRAQYVLCLPKKEEQETYARSIAACVSAALGLENATTKSFISKHGQITDTEAQDAFGEFSAIISAMTSKKGRETGIADIKQYKLVGESIMEGVSYEQFKGLLNKIGVDVVDNIEQSNNINNGDIQQQNNIPQDNEPNEISTPSEENIEVQDIPSKENIQESFFSILDKLENI